MVPFWKGRNTTHGELTRDRRGTWIPIDHSSRPQRETLRVRFKEVIILPTAGQIASWVIRRQDSLDRGRPTKYPSKLESVLFRKPFDE
jgi:hypothetical protein